ncbi:MAG: isoprenyl transferase [Chthoniobacterales bacterium]
MSSDSQSKQSPNIPRHVAIIMDGNGRWAQKRGLPRLHGHEAGAKSIGRCLKGCRKAGVSYLTLYAFSAENWKRPAAEVKGLMALLERFLKEQRTEMLKNNIRLRTIGRISQLPENCQKLLRELEAESKNNTSFTVILALSYGGRDEMIDAVRAIADEVKSGQMNADEIDEAVFSSHLYTAGIPDPDLLIRTSGEMRLSNFLLWQLSYTELYITPTLWPDFDEGEFLKAIEQYGKRSRRYGAIESSS